MSNRGVRARLGLAVLFALVCLVSVASADTVRWIRPLGGAFEGSSNWDRGSPPGAADLAVFDLPGTYIVTMNTNHTLQGVRFSRGDVTLNLNGNSMTLGTPPLAGQGLTVTPGAGVGSCTARLQSGQVPLATTVSVGSGGTLELTNAALSDVLPGGSVGSFVTFSTGSTVRLFGGSVVALSVDIAGGTLLVGPNGYVSGDPTFCSQPSTITVSGANARLAGEIGLSVRGRLSVLNGGRAYVWSGGPAGDRILVNDCEVLVEGAGSSIGPVSMNAGSSMVVQNGGTVGLGVFDSHFGGRVMIGPGGTLNCSAVADAPLWLDHASTVNAGYVKINQGLIVYLDGLSTRTSPLISPTLTGSTVNGLLTVFVRNANSFRVGQVIPLINRVAGDTGSFTAFGAPLIHGGRLLTLAQPTPPSVIAINVVAGGDPCWTSDFNGDGDFGTDADIEAFFACLAGNCCVTCPPNADFDGDGDVGTDFDIEAFFRVLAGRPC